MKQVPMIAQPSAPVSTLPVMPCPRCGILDTPILGPASGLHVGELRCREGHHIKWAPKALLNLKERRTMGGVNRVVLLGVIGKYGVEVRYANSGAPYASFMLVVTEQGQDGKDYATLISCECWGKKAEAAGELEAGQLVLFEGKLAKRRKGEQWELIVSGFELTPVLAPMATLTGTSN